MRARTTVAVGDEFAFERTFTAADVDAFALVSGDAGRHHVEAGEDGRQMVQGLLTATLPTRLGGDLDFVAGTMRFRFRRPVWTGDTIATVATATRVEPAEGRTLLDIAWTCTNQHGEVVMSGDATGFLPA